MYCVSPTSKSQRPGLLHSAAEGGICLAIRAGSGKVRRGGRLAGCAGDVDVTTFSLPLPNLSGMW